ncbi:hypothetical protein [uncultured Chitinophaga sp.]|uniref:hypothetical protein n=1 Tax=uncultured Chitinophaga sp. TaxID=339340 RepID=UPI0025D5F11F|nr:hypothetical protein [uncultured Chitinophaga sp.]
MNGNIFSPEYMLSNAIALLLLGIAFLRPFTAKVILSVIFVAAAIVNGITAIYHPQAYLYYADVAALPVYERFILGYFSTHTTLIVFSIAFLQLAAGVFMTRRGLTGTMALAGSATFLLAIAPLGAGSAFPCSVLLAVSCIVLIFAKEQNKLSLVSKIKNRQAFSVKHIRQYH